MGSDRRRHQRRGAPANRPATPLSRSAVIGVHDPLKGEVPRRFVVLKAGIDTDPDQVSPELAGLVRAQIGAIAALRRVDVVAALPKTRSGKTLRKTMRGIASGHASEPVPSAIDDVAALDAMRPVLREA
jgi:propionyl-CoA synthetase